MILLRIMTAIRTILIIVAIYVILRFIGKLAKSKREIRKSNKESGARERYQQAKEYIKNNEGKVRVVDTKDVQAEDVEYEDVE